MRRLSLGSVSTLEVGCARIVAVSSLKSVIVVLSKDGVRAYWNECKHLPAPLNAEGEELDVREALVCKSHGARYTLEEGLCFSGPCRGKFLDPVPLVREGDELYAMIES
jgi:nitrite reductase/ring-hydroxylating ferredoxin subunit